MGFCAISFLVLFALLFFTLLFSRQTPPLNNVNLGRRQGQPPANGTGPSTSATTNTTLDTGTGTPPPPLAPLALSPSPPPSPPSSVPFLSSSPLVLSTSLGQSTPP